MGHLRDFFDENENYLYVDFNYDRKLPDYDLNDLQKATHTLIKRLGNIVLKDGTVISGEASIVNSTNSTLDVKVSGGYVCIEGKLIPFSEQSFTFNKNSGTQNIYVEVKRLLITATQDGRLTLPTTGEATADRHKWIAVLTTQDTSNIPLASGELEKKVFLIYKVNTDNLSIVPNFQVIRKSNLYLDWLEGLLPLERVSGVDAIWNAIKSRFFNTFGSYIVRGFDIYVENVDTNAGTCNIKVAPGLGYVYGEEVNIRDATIFENVRLGTDIATVNGELKTYNGGDLYQINNSPVKQILRLFATVEVERNITRGSTPGGQDPLPDTPVVQVISVSQGATTFSYGSDYILTGNSIDWSPAGLEPSPGTTYTVRYRYRKQMILDTDYTLNGWNGKKADRPEATYYYFVSAVNSSNQETVFNSLRVKSINVKHGDIVHIDWDSVQNAVKYRIYVCINADPTVRTNFKLVDETTSTEYIDTGIKTPQNTNPVSSSSYLQASPVIILYKENEGKDFVCFGLADRPVSGTDFQYDYEYYLPRIDLIYLDRDGVKRLEGRAMQNPKAPNPIANTAPIGIVLFPAGLQTPIPQNAPLRSVKFDELLNKFEELHDLQYNVGLTLAELDLYRKASGLVKGLLFEDFKGDVYADFTHPEYASFVDTNLQFATHDIRLNVASYDINNMVKVRRGHIIPFTEVVWFEQNRWTRLIDVNPYKALKPPDASISVACTLTDPRQWANDYWDLAKRMYPITGVINLASYVVRGIKFNPNATVSISLRHSGGVLSLGSVPTNADGMFSFTFSLPANITDRTIVIKAIDNGIPLPATAEATINIDTELTLAGRNYDLRMGDRVLMNVYMQDPYIVAQKTKEILLLWNACPPRLRLTNFDPLAYSFFVDKPVWITAVGLYFGAKDDNIPVVIQIRDLTAGLPGNQILAEASVYPQSIVLNQETKITFPEPVRLEAGWYCIVVASDSDKYKVQACKLGEIDNVSGQYVIVNPSDGVVFVSANATSWSIEQDMDLRCRIYRAEFQPSVEYVNTINVNYTHASCMQLDFVPDDCSVEYYYKTSDAEDWKPLPAEIAVDRKSRFYIKVIARSNSDNTDSPVVNPLFLVFYDRQLTGTYISGMYEFNKDVSSIELYVSHNTPQGTSLTVKASNDDGATWITLTKDPTYNKLVNGNLRVYEFKYTGTFPNAGNRVRVRFEMNSSLYSSAVVIHKYGGIVA